jgi:hypothetical protein
VDPEFPSQACVVLEQESSSFDPCVTLTQAPVTPHSWHVAQLAVPQQRPSVQSIGGTHSLPITHDSPRFFLQAAVG